MANLLGQYIEPNYKGMLNFETLNQGISASLQRLTDGIGNNTPISVSNDLIGFSSAVQYDWVSTPAGAASKTTMWFDATGRMSWRPGTGAASYIRTFDATSITANRVYTLPDNSMTFIGVGSPIDSTLRSIVGGGTSPLQLSTTAVAVSTGNLTISNGNINVSGKVTSTGGYNNTSGTIIPSFESSVTCSNAAGSANFRPVSISYTINNSGAQTGTATGIFLNATETALNGMSHNLMDLQRGGASMFKVSRTGSISMNNDSVTISAASSGVLVLYDSSFTSFSRLNFGGTSNSFPALVRQGNTLEVRTADGLSYAQLHAGSLAISGYTFTTLSTRFFIDQDLRGVAFGSSVSIKGGNTAADASSILDVASTTKGVLLPRMTTAQKNAIASPAQGLEVFDTTLVKKCVYNGSAWETITSV